MTLLHRVWCVLVLLVAFVVPAMAQKMVSLTFADSKERKVYIQSSQLLVIPPDAVSVSAKSVELPLTEEQEKTPTNYTLWVQDIGANLMASQPLAEVLKTGKWDPTDQDFKIIAELKIKVTAQDKPLSAGQVILEVAGKKRESLLTPIQKGVITFPAVPFGPAKVGLSYLTTKLEPKNLPTQTFEIAADTTTLNLKVTDDVETLAAETPTETPKATTEEKAAPAAGTAPAKTPPAANPLAGIFQFACSLVILALIGGFIFWYAKNNKQQVQQAMQTVGVPGASGQTADPNNLAPIQQTPVDVPLQTITLPGGNDPIAPVAAVATPMSATPQLRAENGAVYDIPEGTLTIGRENASITLAGESSVSRLHAEITRNGNLLTLTDKGSTNGTYVNGAKLSGSVTLNPGDTIQFGAIRMKVQG